MVRPKRQASFACGAKFFFECVGLKFVELNCNASLRFHETGA